MNETGEKGVKLVYKDSQVEVSVYGMGPRDAIALLLFGVSYLVGSSFEERRIVPATMGIAKGQVS